MSGAIGKVGVTVGVGCKFGFFGSFAAGLVLWIGTGASVSGFAAELTPVQPVKAFMDAEGICLKQGLRLPTLKEVMEAYHPEGLTKFDEAVGPMNFPQEHKTCDTLTNLDGTVDQFCFSRREYVPAIPENQCGYIITSTIKIDSVNPQTATFGVCTGRVVYWHDSERHLIRTVPDPKVWSSGTFYSTCVK